MKTTSLFAFGLALVGTAFTFAISAGPAMATPVEARSVTLVVNPGDLATVSGRSALDARIARAARQVCGWHMAERGLGQVRQQQACVDQAVRDTKEKVAQLKASVIHMAAR